MAAALAATLAVAALAAAGGAGGQPAPGPATAFGAGGDCAALRTAAVLGACFGDAGAGVSATH